MLAKLIKSTIADAMDMLGGTEAAAANDHPSPFTEKVLSYAIELDWKISIESENHIVIGFTMDNDRTQMVHLVVVGEMTSGPVIQVSSPALKVTGNEEVFSKEFCAELLERNYSAPGYGWSIETVGEDEYLVAMAEYMLDTMDIGEMATAVYAISSGADAMEERFGIDEY